MSGKKLILAMFLLAANLFFLLSCDNSIEPLNPREFQWSVDTIQLDYSGYISMKKICGVFKDEMWLTGYVSVTDIRLWKYQNKKWNGIPYTTYTDKENPPINSIKCDSQGNLYIAGHYSQETISKPFICTFIDNVWKTHIVEGERERIYDLSPIDKNNIYAVGGWGKIWTFDGTKWATEKIELNLGPEVQYQISSIVYHDNIMHLLVHTNFYDRCFYIAGTSQNWIVRNTLVWSDEEKEFGTSGLYAGKWGKLYSLGTDLFERKNGQWVKIIDQPNQNNPIFRMDGINENNMILLTSFKPPLHWDGNILREIPFFRPDKNISYADVKFIEDEVFILGYENKKIFVFRGSKKL